jgi:dTDP-4-amino-4,6-dideoxygalactose transaminase
VTTTSAEHADRLRALRSLGQRRTISARVGNGATPYREGYDAAGIGFPYELGEVAAAIGLAQLRFLDTDNARRRDIVARYAAALAGVPGVELPRYEDDRESSYHLYPVLVERRSQLAAKLADHGVHTGVHYPPNELLGDHADLPAMRDFSSRVLSLPLHPQLPDADVDRVSALVREGW